MNETSRPSLRLLNGTPEPNTAGSPGDAKEVRVAPDSLLARRLRCDQAFNELLEINERRSQAAQSIISRDPQQMILEAAQLDAREKFATREALLSLIEMSSANCNILLALAEKAGLVK
jgi:hypothetical protein